MTPRRAPKWSAVFGPGPELARITRALSILHRHGATAPGSEASRRASRALRAAYVQVLGNPRHAAWRSVVHAFGLSRDPDLVPLLAPHLDSAVPEPPEAWPLGHPLGVLPAPSSPRDHALEAIATILEGDPHALYPEVGGFAALEPAAVWRMRDEAAAALRRRLGY